MEYLIVGFGGIWGSLARYGLGKFISQKTYKNFPWGTFLINISGAFLLGIVSTLDVNKTALLLLADGFLGAYTTFSTFMVESFHMFSDNKKKNAVVYIIISLLLGLIGFFLGAMLVKILD